MTTQLKPHIRFMLRRDMPEVFDIDRRSFELPWTERDYRDCLRRHSVVGLVAERNYQIAGYIIYELHRTGLHILNLCVHPDCRREGIGRAMVDKQLAKLTPLWRTSVTAEVREANLDAQFFFRSLGFRAEKVLREFCDETPGDAYLFRYRLAR